MTRAHAWTKAACIVILALLGILFLFGVYGTHSVKLTENQIRDQVAVFAGRTYLNSEGAFSSLRVVKRVSVERVDVRIRDGRLTVFVDTKGKVIGNKDFVFAASVVGAPHYADGSFYFRPDRVTVEKSTLEGETLSQAIANTAKLYVSNKKLEKLLVDITPKAENMMKEKIQRAVEVMLTTRPVYTLKNDAKGYLLRASLQSVAVNGDAIVVTFSLWQLTWSVALGALFLVLAMGTLYAFITRGEVWMLVAAVSPSDFSM